MDWKKIKKDFFLASSSHFFYKIVGYFILTILTRYLAKDEMGEFFFAASLAGFFVMISELGTNSYLTREIAREPKNALDLMSEVVSLRLPLYAGYFILLNGFTYLVKYDIFQIVFLTSIYIFFDQLYQCFGVLFLALKRVKYNVFTGVSTRILLVGFILIVVATKGTLTSIVTCYILANFMLVLIALVLMSKKIGGIRLVWNPDSAKTIFKASFPFFVIALLSLIHFKIDSIMIGFLKPYSEVATYEAAYKLLEASRFIIVPIGMIFFPIFSEMAGQKQWKEIQRLFKKMLLRLGAIGSLIMIMVGLTAGVIIPAVFGPKYNDSILVLKILYFSVPFLYIGMVSSLVAKSILIEKRVIKIMLICVIANILLNSLAIPQWGAMGAAWTTLVTQVLLAVWIVKLNITELRLQHFMEPVSLVGKGLDYVR
jgi:O-antigen/teichoic acid export membrane protein